MTPMMRILNEQGRYVASTATVAAEGNFLAEDGMKFDVSLFSMAPKEAMAIDPQQRILLELTHGALESACYIGSISSEFKDSFQHDPLAINTSSMVQSGGGMLYIEILGPYLESEIDTVPKQNEQDLLEALSNTLSSCRATATLEITSLSNQY
ncbi:hypothetical protein P175DRAFT_0531630 [Aspergillus ochraceoroseus IBT 24754]|uniref:Beta-ketoacyl synthase-like N-terminal domain-containing protein n=1 Tax=Aspergillus ochraceoroseus IBT 24754 TaxID=1392256 RepID=A0A2T5M0M8_9EURO|nr:uncharacterized protein P175DRAFT_0531630 [Aspergillus ochraceoroseus IBT 24754]PTU22079.1 hypothetical protein P175DRAFT_0531630 [Aspergillus ochraceoroseus IBT 24754]